MRYERVSRPSLFVPVPPPPEDNGSHPEDQEHSNDESIVDFSLSVDEVAAWVAGEAPEVTADSLGEKDEEIVVFGHKDS